MLDAGDLRYMLLCAYHSWAWYAVLLLDVERPRVAVQIDVALAVDRRQRACDVHHVRLRGFFKVRVVLLLQKRSVVLQPWTQRAAQRYQQQLEAAGLGLAGQQREVCPA